MERREGVGVSSIIDTYVQVSDLVKSGFKFEQAEAGHTGTRARPPESWLPAAIPAMLAAKESSHALSPPQAPGPRHPARRGAAVALESAGRGAEPEELP